MSLYLWRGFPFLVEVFFGLRQERFDCKQINKTREITSWMSLIMLHRVDNPVGYQQPSPTDVRATISQIISPRLINHWLIDNTLGLWNCDTIRYDKQKVFSRISCASAIKEPAAKAICFRVCRPPGRPAVVRLPVNTHFVCDGISIVSGRILVKLATNIQHVSWHW